MFYTPLLSSTVILCLYAKVFTSDFGRECFLGRQVVMERKSCSKQMKLYWREKGFFYAYFLSAIRPPILVWISAPYSIQKQQGDVSAMNRPTTSASSCEKCTCYNLFSPG